ncbi:unnamed protein product [Amoebophrya sp. A120]|nr:unnamed protein product [Amoebophrya sp. A120]|eukprot:GSA120T00020623001.1
MPGYVLSSSSASAGAASASNSLKIPWLLLGTTLGLFCAAYLAGRINYGINHDPSSSSSCAGAWAVLGPTSKLKFRQQRSSLASGAQLSGPDALQGGQNVPRPRTSSAGRDEMKMNNKVEAPHVPQPPVKNTPTSSATSPTSRPTSSSQLVATQQVPNGGLKRNHQTSTDAAAGALYGICSVVSAAGSVLLFEDGANIDAADAVVRTSQGPVQEFKKHVGARTTLAILSDTFFEPIRKLPRTMLDHLLQEIAAAAAPEPGHHPSPRPKILWTSSWKGVRRFRSVIRQYVCKHKNELDFYISNVFSDREVLQCAATFRQNEPKRGTRMITSGLKYIATLLLTKVCSEVHLYGFQDHPGKPALYHYFDWVHKKQVDVGTTGVTTNKVVNHDGRNKDENQINATSAVSFPSRPPGAEKKNEKAKVYHGEENKSAADYFANMKKQKNSHDFEVEHSWMQQRSDLHKAALVQLQPGSAVAQQDEPREVTSPSVRISNRSRRCLESSSCLVLRPSDFSGCPDRVTESPLRLNAVATCDAML